MAFKGLHKPTEKKKKKKTIECQDKVGPLSGRLLKLLREGTVRGSSLEPEPESHLPPKLVPSNVRRRNRLERRKRKLKRK